MKNIVLLDTSYPINTRNQRIIKSLNKNYSVDCITWKRDNGIINNVSNEFVYEKESVYGSRIKKICNIFGYYKFIYKKMREKHYDVLIASHWDTLIIGSLLKFKFNYKLIYENLDIPDIEIKWINSILSILEKMCLKNTEGMIVASRFFYELYNINKKLVFENYPLKSNLNNISKDNFSTAVLNISFIGTIRYYETLINMIEALKNQDYIIINFWGNGPDENRLKEYCKKNKIDNVKFNGKYEYNKISSIYACSDLVWAAYPSKSTNVKYAISNKFFECLVFNKIGIFAKNTKLGDMIEDKEIGVTVDPYCVDDIEKNIKDILKNKYVLESKIMEFKNIEKIYWEDNEYRLLEFIEDIILT